MRTLDAAQVMDVWERCWPLTPIDRALALRAAASEGSPADVTFEPIGARDEALLRMRAAVFGDAIEALATCPQCSEPVEIATRVSDIVSGERLQMICVDVDGFEIACRVPSSADIAGVSILGGDDDVRDKLIARCLMSARRDGVDIDIAEVPPAVLDAIEDAIAAADPAAETRFEVRCAMCEHTWEPLFDPPSFLWSEMDALARRVAADVHVIASTYGWSEREILALSPARRDFYAEIAAR